MNFKKILAIALLIGLLAISAVSASEDVNNNTITSDIDDSGLELNEISDSTIESPDHEMNFDEKDENNILQSTYDDIYSFVDEDAWFNDKVIWYDGNWDNVEFASIDFLDDLENPENITILLSCDDNPIANVDLAFLNNYDNKITKLTTDSDGIAVYNIPFKADEFEFCIGFWYDENNMTSCVDIGPNMIYSFTEDVWLNGTEDEDHGDDSGDDSGDDLNEFFVGNTISLKPLYRYLPTVPDPTIPWGGVTIDFTKPIVDRDYPRTIDLTNHYIQEDALNKYGSVELNGRDLILKSLDLDNYTIYAEVSGHIYFPYSYKSNGLGGFDAHISLSDVSQGNHNVKIHLYGDSKFDYIYRINYYPVVEMTLPIYMKSSYAISAADLTIYSGGKYSVVLTKDNVPVANANVQIDVNGEVKSVKTGSDGLASIYLTVGEYDLISSYGDVSANSHVTVNSTISADNAAGEYLNSKVNATFLGTNGNALASRQVTFKVGDKTYSATTNAAGVATANIPLGVGTYTVTAVNPVNNEEKQFQLEISKASSQVSLSSAKNNGVVTLTATLTPTSATGNVAFNIGGQNKYVVIKNGKATLILNDWEAGNYEASANYNGDNNFNPSASNTVSFTVEEAYPILTANDLTKTYGSDSKFVVNLVDSRGNAIANVNVSVNINNQITPITTDNNGRATMPIGFKPGEYMATVTYENSQDTAKITVKKATPKITAKAKTIKLKDKAKKYTVTLKNGKKLINGVTVKITVNKITYSVKTKNGVATFKLTKLTKKGKYAATVKSVGNKYYNSKTVKNIKITVK